MDICAGHIMMTAMHGSSPHHGLCCVLQVLLDHLDVPAQEIVAVGDGSNDLQMVSNVGMGVAMGNAVEHVKHAAAAVVASNDDGGIVEAFERYVF
jgi:hydroxymethylpyrimidine pyrophosphatase-like HAD family hydrolase